MDKRNVKDAIIQPCKICNVGVENNLPEKIIEQLSKNSGQIELTWFQVLMDKLYKLAIERDKENPELKISDFEKLGRIDKVITTFVDDQLQNMDNGENGEAVLKTLVSVDGTKRQLTIADIDKELETLGKKLDKNEIKEIVKYFTDVRILSDKDENDFYEFRHDSIAARIFERMSTTEKELSEVRKFIQNSVSSYNTRNKLLDANDLSYIAPYKDKLILNKEQKEFIDKSEKEIKRAKNRKIRLIGLGVIFLLAFSSGFTVWALISANKAKEQKEIALEKEREAAILYQETLKANYKKFKSDGNNSFNLGEFEGAIENYELARTFIDSSELDILSGKVKAADSLSVVGEKIIADAESLVNNGAYYQAKLKYQEAIDINYKVTDVQDRIDEINSTINAKISSLLKTARDLINQGYPDMAKIRVNEALKLDPDNTEAKNLLSQLN